MVIGRPIARCYQSQLVSHRCAGLLVADPVTLSAPLKSGTGYGK